MRGPFRGHEKTGIGGSHIAAHPRKLNEQKFFGSFFQKRTALLFEKRSKNFC
jgi:hypothetical protein